MSYSNHLSGDGSSPNNAVCEMAWQKMDCNQAIAGIISWLQRRQIGRASCRERVS